jgi:predicted ester cyclase
VTNAIRRRASFAALAAPALLAALPADAATGDEAAILTRFAGTLSAHDMAGFAALFAENYVNHQVSAAAPPPPPGRSEKQGTVGFFAARLAGMPDLHVAIEASVTAPGMAAASFVYTGTQTGTLMGVAPTGRKLRFTSCDIFRIENGLLAEHWGMGDIAGVLAQIKS